MRRRLPLLALLALLALPLTARAHGLDANRVQVVLHDEVAEVVATPGAEAARFADASGDGLLDVSEVRARQDDVLRALRDAVSLTDEAGRPGAVERADVSVPAGDTNGAGGRDYLRLTVVYRFAAPPRALRLRCGFVGEHPLTVFATRADARAQPGSLTLVGDPVVATLPRPDAEVALFGPAVPRPAPPPTSPPPPPPPSRAKVIAVFVALLALAGGWAARRRAR